ncbi:AfsR/SARP family transcriptional regulator [Actinoalloteichus hymeniacidonis]|uniref:DNA-binding transcriptional activator of the SARP family n=1 Tax=Actinoalloteichus hymeniacidonis TaxID=340345 RepID=A0AAC9HT09_9PSEU|nr:BTAD domain-containing putative transcriptional regulator [Actinoalloteichus hymeniacidonis]AOS64794.1 DNA-binding transcriptional activator of the SARP family [Actinoalloteichus hymeniacidonis]MBB5907131.1 DNA-binding SARP family transcriptional activator/tetratricopeptide (TPR) repeat protein [Actinoalloteichus hymeniacidonis]
MTVEFKILGETRILVGGTPVELKRNRVRCLLALLLLHANTTVSRDRLLHLVWSSSTAVDSSQVDRSSLQDHIKLVRRSIKNLPASLSSVGAGYRLDVEKKLIDYHRFGDVLAAARSVGVGRDPARVRDLLAPVVDLWDAQPLLDLKSQRAESLREEMIKDRFLPACLLLAESHLALGHPGDVLALFDRVEAAHDVDQRFAVARIDALIGLGRHEDAASLCERTLEDLSKRGRFIGPEIQARQELLRPSPQSSVRPAPIPVAVEMPRPQQLPQASNLVGRADLLAKLDDAMPAEHEPISGVIVLHSAGGCGKTALAVTWAHRPPQLARFPDGRLFVDLEGYGPGRPADSGQVLADFLVSFGVDPDAIPARLDQRVDRLRELLAGKRVLAILDNARDEAHIRPLLDALSGCHILVTSRNRFEDLTVHYGAEEIEVGPLTVESSRRYLTRGIGSPRAVGDPMAFNALIDLCGGIPLALRILRARASKQRSTPLAALLEEEPRHLLEYGSNRPLSVVFSGSYEVLGPETRWLFRSLGGHPGAIFGVEAAAAVADLSAEATRRNLELLVEAHLIEPEVRGRYRFHDLLREYAVGLLDLDPTGQERTAVVRRILDWYLLVARNAESVINPTRELDPLPGEVSTLQLLTFSGVDDAMGWFEREGPNLFAAVEAGHTCGMDAQTWRIANTFGDVFYRLGQADRATRALETALASARRIRENEPAAEFKVLNNLGFSYMNQRRNSDAFRVFRLAYSGFERMDHAEGMASILANLAFLETRIGDPQQAVVLAEKSLDIYTRLNKILEVGQLRVVLGIVYRMVGDRSNAIGSLWLAVGIGREIDALQVTGDGLLELSVVYLEMKEIDLSVSCASDALALLTQVKSGPRIAAAHLALAKALYGQSDLVAAERHAGAAVHLLRLRPDAEAAVRALEILSDVLIAQDRLAEAREATGLAIELLAAGHPLQADLRSKLAALGTTSPR